MGAPRAGFPDEWNALATRDFETLLTHTIEGYRNMPPLGTCSYCSEDELRDLIALMVAGSEIEIPGGESEVSR